MAIDLKTPHGVPNEAEGSGNGKYTKLFENLQGNILKGFARKYMRLLFLNFEGEEQEVKQWIKGLKLTSTMDQLYASKYRKLSIKKGVKPHDGGLVMNFFLSAKGYEELGFDPKKLGRKQGNKIFQEGMNSKRSLKWLGDSPTKFEKGYKEEIHALLLLADDDEQELIKKTEGIKSFLEGNGIAMVFVEEKGAALDNQKEHFGYKDGISNPRFISQDIEKEIVERTGADQWNPILPLKKILIKDPFTDRNDDNYGSFLVYRKLEQDVEGFDNKIAELAKELVLTKAQKMKGVTAEEYAGALAVGRFKDGTPLALSDTYENKMPNGDVPSPNNFTYENTDRKGRKCPFHAHIRKTNPRGQGLIPKRFITRRAIPYGKPNDSNKKGLLFMCFQSNLRAQFVFLQKAWANNPAFPRPKTGIDPVIGAGKKVEQQWPKTYNSKDKVDFYFGDFVTMRGGEYFFAPSIGFLNKIDTIK
ncbi:Dyp-type peroxidase [Aureispira anguillae]|uniref:Dyp-type peroxidase n=1 Tax=Aureispira anguillae TaxID=2864201 RepID=A0A916DT79_9BACT|nr:Dyp-type peroxidase [Aureispira anguillae]BDS11276.1 Dyp-type peroxidase [Aureispira anguillae]